MAAGGSSRTRAAASSIARGNPSSRWQISATGRAIPSESAKSLRASRARSTKSRTAGFCASVIGGGRAARSGDASCPTA